MVALSCGCEITVNDQGAADGVVDNAIHDRLTGLLTLERTVGADVTATLQSLDTIALNTGIAGDVLTRVAAGDTTTTADFNMRQRHFTLPEQVMTVNHTAAGPLTFSVTGQTKAVKINASADITGLAVTGMDLSGPEWSQLRCLLLATATINVDLADTNVVLTSGQPSPMTSGDAALFTIERWDF